MDDVLVYTVNDIMKLLDLSRNSAYDLVRSAYEKKDKFRVIKANGTYRIPKDSFLKWVSEGTN